MSLSRWQALTAVFFFAGLFSATRFVRAWLAKPLLDEVLVPAANGVLDFSVVEGRLWQLGLILIFALVITPVAMF